MSGTANLDDSLVTLRGGETGAFVNVTSAHPRRPLQPTRTR